MLSDQELQKILGGTETAEEKVGKILEQACLLYTSFRYERACCQRNFPQHQKCQENGREA